MIGHDRPRPGSETFQRTLRSGPHSTGSPFSAETLEPPGPRNCVQSLAPLTLPSPPRGEGLSFFPSPLGGEGRVRGGNASPAHALRQKIVRFIVPPCASVPNG